MMNVRMMRQMLPNGNYGRCGKSIIFMETNKNMKSYLLTEEEIKLIAKYRTVKDDDVKFSVNLILDMARTVEEYNSNLEARY